MSDPKVTVLEDPNSIGSGDTLGEQFYEDKLRNVQSEREIVEALESRKGSVEYVIAWHRKYNCIIDMLARFADKTMLRMTAPMPGMLMGGVIDPQQSGKPVPDDLFEKYVSRIETGYKKIINQEGDVPEEVLREGRNVTILKNIH